MYMYVIKMFMQYLLKLIKKGVLLPYVNFEDRCTNCGVCEVSCPDQAITVDVDGNWWVKEDSYNFNPKFSQAK